MSERRARRKQVSQRVLQRAIRAAKNEGMADRYGFQIVGDTLRIIPLDAAAAAVLDGPNPWDEVLNNADQKRAS
jgi:hypothetical protein